MKERKMAYAITVMKKRGPNHKCKSAKLFLLEGIEFVIDSQSGVKITKLEKEVGSPISEV